MDNFVNFLLDYYIWILGVLLIIIITIIGFLVDSSQKRKKKEKALEQEKNSSKLEEVQTVQSLPEENATPVMDAKNATAPLQNSNMTSANSVRNQTVQNVLQDTKTVQSDNKPINNNGTIPMEQNLSISDQKPHFEAREVNIPIGQSPNQPVNNIVPQSNIYKQNAYETQQPVMQSSLNMKNQNVSNFAPKPINAVSINNQPVQPQFNNQMMNNGYMQNPHANAYNMSNNVNNYTQNSVNQTPVQPIPNPVVQPASTIPNSNQNVQATQMPNIGINFVTGSNNEEDRWKL